MTVNACIRAVEPAKRRLLLLRSNRPSELADVGTGEAIWP
jgi:2-succinyl-5-enolpyruvyl-6-hydroxy-3-cyclohexene-1-carboxylate synthase